MIRMTRGVHTLPGMPPSGLGVRYERLTPAREPERALEFRRPDVEAAARRPRAPRGEATLQKVTPEEEK